jgi:hypothetical protein
MSSSVSPIDSNIQLRKKHINTLKWNTFYLHFKYYSKFALWSFAICIYPGIVCPFVETYFPEKKIYAVISCFVFWGLCYLIINNLSNYYKINLDKITEHIDYESEMINQLKQFNFLPHLDQSILLTQTRTLEQAKAFILARSQAEAHAKAQAEAHAKAQAEAHAKAKTVIQTKSNIFVKIGSWIGWLLWFIVFDVILGFLEYNQKYNEKLEEKKRRLVQEYPEEYKFINGNFRRRIYHADGELPDELNLTNVHPE